MLEILILMPLVLLEGGRRPALGQLLCRQVRGRPRARSQVARRAAAVSGFDARKEHPVEWRKARVAKGDDKEALETYMRFGDDWYAVGLKGSEEWQWEMLRKSHEKRCE